MNGPVKIRGEVIAILRGPSGVRVHRTHNIVTTDGDRFYAQRGARETPANFTDGSGVFDGVMELATDTGVPLKSDNRSNVSGLVAGSQAAMAATYPKSNDGDAANTGRGVAVVSYKSTWAAGVATATGIAAVLITNPTPGASEPLLLYAKFDDGVFDKGAADDLVVFCNDLMVGE
jgi:hypothetical protein